MKIAACRPQCSRNHFLPFAVMLSDYQWNERLLLQV